MKSYDHIIVIDAIAFAGGSKVATNDLLMTFIEPTQKITVITRDRNSWDQRFHTESTCAEQESESKIWCFEIQ